ncbi:MAG: glycosyltransferase family 2 protein [Armatimonadetes bacterium]|nr:glycosyltransferase family 2 protein [Armatimonadota bacterium]
MSRQVSVLLCTRNRAPDLKETLVSLGQVQPPEGIEAEVVVIDNGSTDETGEVVANAKIPWATSVRCVIEPKPGVANARNRALAEAKGEIIVFVDDDIRFEPEWMTHILAPFESESADAVAGSIRLAPHLQKDWMTPKHETMYASTRPAEERGDVYLTGANMAFRKSVLEKVPGFDPRLGPGALGFSEESLFSDQIKEAGFKMVRAPKSLVIHHFRPDRLSRESLQKAGYSQGRSLAYIAYHWKHDETPISGLQAMRAKLGYLRRSKAEATPSGGATPLEIDFYTSKGYAEQLKEEMKGPRRYDKRGLKPKSG